eukprot:1493713-Lingulodinium_polyedra.AAC.1
MDPGRKVPRGAADRGPVRDRGGPRFAGATADVRPAAFDAGPSPASRPVVGPEDRQVDRRGG